MNTNDIATKQDIQELKSQLEFISQLIRQIAHADDDKLITISELSKSRLVGGYDRIKTLIRKGLIKTTSDGKILRRSVNEYLKNSSHE